MAKASIAHMMESTISGIPCFIDVETCNVVKGSFDYNAASDWDYHGYTEIEFTVYDRKGYIANWLAKKMTDEDVSRIEGEILAQHEDDFDDSRCYND